MHLGILSGKKFKNVLKRIYHDGREHMKTTIELAREAAGDDWKLFQDFMPEIHRLADLVRADEREACARIAEEPSTTTYECTVACGGPAQTFTQRFPKHSHDIAKEIRARGQA